TKARPCWKAYFQGFGDAADYFASKTVSIALEGGDTLLSVAAQKHVRLKSVVPKEGALGWMDVYAVTRAGAKNPLTYKWINYVLRPNVQRQIALFNYWGPVNPGAAKLMTPGQKRDLHLDDPRYFYKLVPIINPVPPYSFAKLFNIWNAVKSG